MPLLIDMCDTYVFMRSIVSFSSLLMLFIQFRRNSTRQEKQPPQHSIKFESCMKREMLERIKNSIATKNSKTFHRNSVNGTYVDPFWILNTFARIVTFEYMKIFFFHFFFWFFVFYLPWQRFMFSLVRRSDVLSRFLFFFFLIIISIAIAIIFFFFIIIIILLFLLENVISNFTTTKSNTYTCLRSLLSFSLFLSESWLSAIVHFFSGINCGFLKCLHKVILSKMIFFAFLFFSILCSWRRRKRKSIHF